MFELRHLWRLRPRPFLKPWKWRRAYYAWRVETYTGIAAEEVSWRVVVGLLRGPENRRALRRYAAWLGRMRRLRGR